MVMVENIRSLKAQPIEHENFHRYGQVIWAQEDGKSYGLDDAQLILDQGTPRFYVMRLYNKGREFHRITRHLLCTQCLGSMEGKTWLIAVAPPNIRPDLQAKPELDDIQAFEVPGNCFVKLHLGAWHAGPFFDAEFIDFYNLELANTNLTDHHTCDIKEAYGLSLCFGF
jgi:ureidoglycolate hydrolase